MLCGQSPYLTYLAEITLRPISMTKLTILNNNNNNIIAQGILGTEVLEVEGYYYFPRSQVNLENTAKVEKAYFCPIKKSSCDYYYLKDENGNIMPREMCWIYEAVENTLFKQITGLVGFYARDMGNGVSLKTSK
jgi:uncharacterized protein (DUF427 family)